MVEETFGRIVSALVLQEWMLGTKLGDWYNRNCYHKYNCGDILILKNRGAVGFGVRPVMVIEGYDKDLGVGSDVKETYSYVVTRHTDLYDSTWQTDVGDQVDEWRVKNEVPKGIERVVGEHEVHFKWNLEYLFRRVCVRDVDEALALYGSRERVNNRNYSKK